MLLLLSGQFLGGGGGERMTDRADDDAQTWREHLDHLWGNLFVSAA